MRSRAPIPPNKRQRVPDTGCGVHFKTPHRKIPQIASRSPYSRQVPATQVANQVDMAAMTIRVEDTKSGKALEFPVTGQLASILERRFAERKQFAGETRRWVFPSEVGASGHLEGM